MKNTKRVRRKPAIKSANSQSEIIDAIDAQDALDLANAAATHEAEFKLPEEISAHAACICIYNRTEKLPSRKVPISEDEFNVIWRKSILPGAQPLDQFIAAAIREKLARSEASLKQRMAILELKDCVESYVGLTTILAEKTEDRGLMSLANNTTVKLLRDLTAVSDAFKSGATASVGSEVAS